MSGPQVSGPPRAWFFGGVWRGSGFGAGDGLGENGRLPGEELADVGAAFVGGGAEPAVVADALEAGWEGVLEETAYEFVAGKAEGFLLAALAAGVGDGEVAAIIGEDACGTEGTLADVAGEVADGGVSFADVTNVGVPAESPDFWVDGFVEGGVGLAQGALHEGAHAGVGPFGLLVVSKSVAKEE